MKEDPDVVGGQKGRSPSQRQQVQPLNADDIRSEKRSNQNACGGQEAQPGEQVQPFPQQ